MTHFYVFLFVDVFVLNFLVPIYLVGQYFLLKIRKTQSNFIFTEFEFHVGTLLYPTNPYMIEH